MNRIALMILNNLFIVPGAFGKLCHYAKHTDKYPEQEKWDHIHYIMSRAVKGGNVDLQVTGQEYLKTEGGFMLYGNHQGLFDVLAIAASCETPLSIVYKKRAAQCAPAEADLRLHQILCHGPGGCTPVSAGDPGSH